MLHFRKCPGPAKGTQKARNKCCQRHSHSHSASAKPDKDRRKNRLCNDRYTPDNTEPAVCANMGNLNAVCYLNNVLSAVVLHFIHNQQSHMRFQHDNGTIHTARITRPFLANNNINVMQWPAVSPDVSPIEHLWDELARRVRDHLVQPQNLQQHVCRSGVTSPCEPFLI